MSKNDHFLSLSKAAKETGKSKSVISKALNDGTISNHGKDQSGYKIDPAELFRVFPRKERENGFENEQKERLSTPKNDLENALEIKELQLELKAEQKEKDFYKNQFDAMKTERDDWKNQAQKLLLTQHVEKSPQKAADSVSESSGTTLHGPRQEAIKRQNFVAVAVLIMMAVGIGYLVSEVNNVRRDIDAIPLNQNFKSTQLETLNEVTKIEPASGSIAKEAPKPVEVIESETSSDLVTVPEEPKHGIVVPFAPSSTELEEYGFSPSEDVKH